MTATATPAFIRGRQSDKWLKLTCDRKVSPMGWYQESRKRWVPKTPNSFGLPAGDSCPGKTEFCESCYAAGNENQAGVHELVMHNFRLLQAARRVDAMAQLLKEMIGRYVREADRRELPPADRIFRIHWDGDFFSEDYAKAWAITILAYPSVQFWAYTRSFRSPLDVTPILVGLHNLELYLSADEYNIKEALEAVASYPELHLALCGVDYKTTRQLTPQRKARICPENSGKMELMANGRGACVECRLCPDGRADIIFATSHEHRTAVQLRMPLAGESNGAVCQRPGCDNRIRHRSSRGRPALYCSQDCRWLMSRVKQRRQKTQKPTSTPPQSTPRQIFEQWFSGDPATPSRDVRPKLQLVDEHYRVPVAIPSRRMAPKKPSDRAMAKQKILEILEAGPILDPNGRAIAILSQQIGKPHAYTDGLLRELYVEVERVMVRSRCRELRLIERPAHSDLRIVPATK